MAITPMKTLNASTHVALCVMYLNLFFFICLSFSPTSGSFKFLGRSLSISTYLLSQIFWARSCGIGGTEVPITTGWLAAEIIVAGDELRVIAGGDWIVASLGIDRVADSTTGALPVLDINGIELMAVGGGICLSVRGLAIVLTVGVGTTSMALDVWCCVTPSILKF